MSNLSIITHVVNENITKLESKDFLSNVLSTCIDCMDVFMKLSQTRSNDPADYDEFIFPDTSVLLQFVENRHSLIPIVNNVLHNALEAMENLDIDLDSILDDDDVSEGMQDAVVSAAEDGRSCMSTFIFYEFLNTPGYDEIVYSYCNKKSIPMEMFIKEYAELYKNYRRSLGVFNDYPEYEQPFIEMVGPALSMIPEDVLTVEDVTNVLRGVLSVEDLLMKLGISESDDCDTELVASSVF